MTQAVYHKGLYYENVINYNNMHVNAEKDNTVIVLYFIKKCVAIGRNLQNAIFKKNGSNYFLDI